MDFLKDAEQLRAIGLFAQLDDSRLKLLAFASEEVSFDDGDIVFSMNAVSDSAYVVMSGELQGVCEPRGGRRTACGFRQKRCGGEMGVIRNQPRSATLKAHGPVRCLRILTDDFLNLLRDNPEVSLGSCDKWPIASHLQ